MFKITRISILFLATTIFSYCIPVYAKITLKANNNQKMINQQIINFMKKYNIPGAAVAVIDNGKSNIYVFGVADKETNKPITSQTIFELGSITKLFTTLILAKEINNHQMKIKDSLTQYLPTLAKNENFNQITLQELATYSASLPFMLPNSVTNSQQIQDYLLHWQPQYPIGSVWQYSNISIGLLGNILEAKNKMAIYQLYNKNIFKPLHMNSATIILTKRQQENLAQGYTAAGIPAKPVSTELLPAAGASKASIHDLANFLVAAVGLPNTPKNIHEAMQFAQTPRAIVGDVEQALSWQLTSLKNKNLLSVPENMNLEQLPLQWLSTKQQQFNPEMLIDKTGATDGFRAYIAVIPAKKSGIVILTNRYVSNGAIVNIGRNILMNLK